MSKATKSTGITNQALKEITTFTTGKCRLSYVHLFEPSGMPGSNVKKFSVCLLIPKSDTRTVGKIKAAIAAIKEAHLNSTYQGKIPANFKLPLRDGDAEKPEDPAYANHWFMNASADAKKKIGIVDLDNVAITDSTAVYSGCYGRASVNIYAFNTNGNKGIAVGLNHVQFIADGEPLGGQVSLSDAFAEEYTDDDLS